MNTCLTDNHYGFFFISSFTGFFFGKAFLGLSDEG